MPGKSSGKTDSSGTSPLDPVLSELQSPQLGLSGPQEAAWIEVIRKMEEVYSDLIRYEVDLEEKNAQLSSAHDFIQSILGSMSELLIVCNRDGQIEQVNQATLDITGYDQAGQLCGQPLRTLVVSDDDNAMARLLSAPESGRGPSAEDYVEVALATRSGGVTDLVSLNGSLRIDHAGRSAGLVLIGRPMGELRRAYQALNKAHMDLKRTQQQLIQSEKMASIGRLVAGVAHELNNPISFINGNIHALVGYRERMVSYLEAIHNRIDEEHREELRQSLRIDHILSDLEPLIAGTLEGANRVSDIVKSLRRLSFSGAEPNEALEVYEVVQTSVQWAVRGTKRPMEVQLDAQRGLYVTGHAGQIHQVMVNLLDNALHAVSQLSEPEVMVRVRAMGEGVAISVEDNGVGIAEADLMRVFDPFFTTKSVGKGTGLGLWISYGIIKDHGGDLTASNRDGGGARFVATLPRCAAP